jgi:hypothetical protein
MKYPWLNFLAPVAEAVIKTLKLKEAHYKGSWQKRGGPGAFMMLARKWDRIEGICREDHNYDIFEACDKNTADIVDDVDDLIGYLLLVRARLAMTKEDADATDPVTDA